VVQRQQDFLINRHRERLIQQGIPKEEHETILGGLKAEARNKAESEVRRAYILRSISSAEKIEVQKEEVSDKIKEIASSRGPEAQSKMEEVLNRSYHDQVMQDIEDKKIFDFLIHNAKIKTISGGA